MVVHAAMRSKTCCFTGHRDIPELDVELIEKRTEEAIWSLYEKGVRCYRVGGAVGYDTLVADILFRLRASQMPDIKVILVYPFDGFTKGWTDEQRAHYDLNLPYFDEVVRVCDGSSKSAFWKRDRYLVDGSAYCIAYQTRNTGGTAYTTRYARQQGVKLICVTECVEIDN